MAPWSAARASGRGFPRNHCQRRRLAAVSKNRLVAGIPLAKITLFRNGLSPEHRGTGRMFLLFSMGLLVMAQTVEIVAQERKDYGTRVPAACAKAGRCRASSTGTRKRRFSVSVSGAEFVERDRHGAASSTSSRVTPSSGTDQGSPVGSAWPRHPARDFTRYLQGEKLELPVRIELRGTAPGVTGGGVLSQSLHELTIECLPDSIPNSIRVQYRTMQIGDVIHVRELTLPPGVAVKGDPDAVVVQIMAPIVERSRRLPQPAAEGAGPK